MQDATTGTTITNDEDNVLIDVGSNPSVDSSESTTSTRIHLTIHDGNAPLMMIQVGQGIALTLSFIVFSLVFASVGANAPLTKGLMLNVISGNLIVAASVFAVWWNAQRSMKD